MRDRRVQAYGLVVVATVAAAMSGCGWLLGLDEFVDAPPPVGGGQGGSGGGSCEPGETASCCYEGPDGTEGVGLCAAGTRTCNADGTSHGACEGQTTPAAETCANPTDEDCDGHDCVLWAQMFGDVTSQSVQGVVTATDGSIYVAGWFTGTLVFDPQQPISANGVELYVAKLDASANLIWAKSFPTTAGSGQISGATTDAEGNLIIAGIINGPTDFDGTILNPGGYDSAYVAKLAPDGHLLWATPVAIDDTHEVAKPATDSDGNIILFGTHACVSVCFPETTRMWLRKLDPDGSTLWSKHFDTVEYMDSHLLGGVTVDPFENIIVTGAFKDTERFGPYLFTSAGSYDIFLLKLDQEGTPVWKGSYGDASAQISTGVASDHLGNVFITGHLDGSVNFGPGAPLLSSAGGADIFLAKLSSAKAHLWSKSFGDADDQRGGQIVIAVDGITLTGRVAGKLDFGGEQLTSESGSDVPLVKLDLDGSHVWSRIIHGDLTQGHTVTSAPGGEALLAGAGQGKVDVGTGPLTSAGELDVLLARFAR